MCLVFYLVPRGTIVHNIIIQNRSLAKLKKVGKIIDISDQLLRYCAICWCRFACSRRWKDIQLSGHCRWMMGTKELKNSWIARLECNGRVL
jgi:hypothetical protein